MEAKRYEAWKRDIVAEYTLKTFKTFPKGEQRAEIQRMLGAYLGGLETPPSPSEMVNLLIQKGLLQGE